MKSTELSHGSRSLPVRARLRARPGLARPYLPPRHSMIWVIGAIGLALYCAYLSAFVYYGSSNNVAGLEIAHPKIARIRSEAEI